MAVKNPTVTKMEDIQTLLKDTADAVDTDAAPKDPTDNGADNTAPLSLAAQMRKKAEQLGEQYLAHHLGGGKRKAFLASLSDDDAAFFRALRIDEVIAESITKELTEKAKAAKPDGEVFDKLVEKEKAKNKTKSSEEEKKKKPKKNKAAGRLIDNINNELFRVIGRGLN